MDKEKTKEVSFQEAVSMAETGSSRMVWLGREPVEYIRGLLNLPEDKMEALEPSGIMSMDKKTAQRYDNCIMVCYHGNTSRRVAELLSERFGVESFNLKGGITAIVGEIF